MIISEHSGRTITHQAGGWEPQRTANFAIVISGLADAERLVLCTKKLKIPGVAVSKQAIKYFNESTHYAGAVEPFGDSTINFRDYIDVDVISVLAKWYNQVWQPDTGTIGWASDYKKTAEVYLLPPSLPGGSAVPLAPFRNRIWTLYGLWPTKLDYPDLDNDATGEQSIIELVLSVDRAMPAQLGSV